MFNFDLDFYNKLATLSIKHFKNLPKTGKPNLDEWTVLSTIGKFNNTDKKLEIVALGTGTKCIGASKMSPNGDILNDSHAEIICRRAFLRYLYHEITLALLNDKNNSIFIKNNEETFELKQNITFHFFTTQTPCGDASIFPKQNFEDFGNCVNKFEGNDLKRSLDCEDERQNKKMKIEENDINRTGAKCLKDDVKQDPKNDGSEYHVVGVVRTKPGRGDPTLSVSCSDKIAKWSFVGIQGSLLNILIKFPIYLKSITISKNTPFCKKSFLRSIKNRFKNFNIPGPFQYVEPFIEQCDIEFENYKNNKKRPCSSSIIWSKIPDRPLEVSVDGKKQGVTKKNRDKKEGRLLICKKELFSTFVKIIVNHKLKNFNLLQNMSYEKAKQISNYFNVWEFVKTNIFEIWTKKDECLLNFVNDK